MTAPAGATFRCTQCGAELAYDAGAQTMACTHCGTRQAVGAASSAEASTALREIPIEEGMRLAPRGLGAQVTTLGCNDCGATVHVSPGEQTAKCAFCGSSQVLPRPTDPNVITPGSLVPFGITKQAANETFAKWLGKLWFRPGDLKAMAKVQEMGGVYVPYWSFDATAQSQWRAERGFRYYETERTSEGERQVERIRWEPASGWRRDPFIDLLICAGKGLPEKLVEKLATFDQARLTPYRPDYLAGWRAESYAVDLLPAWEQAQAKISREQIARCGKDVGGDTQRNLEVETRCSHGGFKHVLLPIWIAAYRYDSKAYRFLVNGQTGEVVGEAPWSVPKILLLVAVIGAAIAALVLVLRAHAHAPAAMPAVHPAVHAAPAPGRRR